MMRFTVMTKAYVDRGHPQACVGDIGRMDRVAAIVEEFRGAQTAHVVTPRRKLRWWWMIAVVPIAILVTLVMAPAETPTPITTPIDWSREVQRIDAVRMRAFMTSDRTLLDDVLVLRSPAYRHDTAVLQRLAAADIVLDHNPVEVISVEEVERTLVDDIERATIKVVDRLDAHGFVTDTQSVVTESGRGARSWLLRLRRSDAGVWKLYSVTATAWRSSTPASDQGM